MRDKLFGAIGLILTVLFVVGIVWFGVIVGTWHHENWSHCMELGGSYDALDGSGQCVKDQTILFDPHHPWRK